MQIEIQSEKFSGSRSGEVPFLVKPDVHRDKRGSFAEQWNLREEWPAEAAFMADMSWVKQVNRSESLPGVARGMHAQAGSFCQGKLVEAVYGTVYDVIVDARLGSPTFGKIAVYMLDSREQTKLWVPRGFLHGFVVSGESAPRATFQYMVDAPYCREAETGCSPLEVLRAIDRGKIEADGTLMQTAGWLLGSPKQYLSDKDLAGEPLSQFLQRIAASRKAWHLA